MIKTVLAVYAIEKGRGSEQGSGYNFCLELAKRGDVDLTIVTRENNARALRNDTAFASVRVVGYDPPRWLTFWKRGGRNIIAYYYLWQLGMARRVVRLMREDTYDVAHVYNFHTDWAPQFLARTDLPVVWGPICHQPKLPSEFFRGVPATRRVKDGVRWTVKNAFWRLDPNLRRAARSTDVVLYANQDVAPPFQQRPNVRQQTFGGASFVTPAHHAVQRDEISFLHVGRSVEIKGAHLAIDAFSQFLERGGSGKLTVVGEGELRNAFEERATSLGMQGHVNFLDWMPQAELQDIYTAADVFIYPSLGNQDTVVAEALAAGLPVLCVAGSGTETMAGEAALVAPRRNGAISAGIATAMLDLEREYLQDHDAFARRRDAALVRSGVISWSHTAASIVGVYRELAAV